MAGYSVDSLIERAATADSKEESLAALTLAAASLNADLENLGSRHVQHRDLLGVEGFVPFEGLEERTKKYIDAVEGVAKKFRPRDYQIRIGYPIGVSATFEWDVPKA